MKKIASLALLVILGGCTAIEVLAPPVDNLFVSEAKLSQEEAAHLQKGRKIYLNMCQRCHSVRQVDEISAEAWEKHIPKMYKKAKLFPEEQKAVEAYLKAAAPINQRLIMRREELKNKK